MQNVEYKEFVNGDAKIFRRITQQIVVNGFQTWEKGELIAWNDRNGDGKINTQLEMHLMGKMENLFLMTTTNQKMVIN